MSIASRRRSLDRRAPAIAASASARWRTTSPISAAADRSLAFSFGPGSSWRLGRRAIAARLRFLGLTGRVLGI
jgi:hypothetical protein